MKTQHLAFIISLVFLVGCGNLTGLNKNALSGISSFEVVPPTEVDEFAESDEFIDQLRSPSEPLATNGALSWYPDGTRGRGTIPECRLSVFKSKLRASTNVHDFDKAFKDYFKQCEEPLSIGTKVGYLTELKLTTLRYEVAQNPLIKHLEIKFDTGEKVRAMMALKPDFQKRPFVIARCGVFCDITDRLPRIMIMHLFDEQPFNVIVLASTTGADFVKDNKSLGIGGYLEAVQHMKLAEYLQSPQSGLADRITKVHVIGASLGGNSSLFTSLVSQNNRLPNGESPIASSFSMCPVVNLEETLDAVMRNNSFRGYLISLSAWDIIQTLLISRGEALPERKPEVRQYYDIVGVEAVKKYGFVFSLPNFRLAPFSNVVFDRKEAVWDVNRFTDHANNIDVPTYAWSSDDDPVVPTSINTKRLEQQLKNYPSSSAKAFTVPGGRHCAEGLVYGWSTVSETFRSFIYTQDPEYQRSEIETQYNLVSSSIPERAKTLAANEFHFTQRWSLEKNASEAQLHFQIWSPRGAYHCEAFGPYSAYRGCFREVTMSVPLSAFTNNTTMRVPQTDAEAQATTRWLNGNVTVHTNSGEELHHTRNAPTLLKWKYF